MKTNKSISVIVPLYNAEKYIEECLDSVVCQLDENDQLVIVNDGSTDNSLNVVKKYLNCHNNIIIENTDNKGAAAARNIGLSISKGDYILFLDSDDYLSNDTISNFKKIIEQHNPELILGGSKKLLLNGDTQIRILNIDEGLYSVSELLNHISNVSDDPPIPQCYYLYKRELISNNKFTFFEGHIHEDELWTQEILLNTDKVYYSKYVFYNYCVRKNSVMTSTNINKSGEDSLEICKHIKKMFDSKKKGDIPNLLKNRFSELLLMANYQLNDNSELIRFTGKTMPLVYSYKRKTIIKSLIFMLSPSLHRKIERYRLR